MQACVEFNRGRYLDSLELYKVCYLHLFFNSNKIRFLSILLYILLSLIRSSRVIRALGL